MNFQRHISLVALIACCMHGCGGGPGSVQHAPRNITVDVPLRAATSTADWASGEATLELAGRRIEIELPGVSVQLPAPRILSWVDDSAHAVAAYYRYFPVERYALRLLPVAGSGVHGGTTWSWPHPRSRVRLGNEVTERELLQDWIMVHEMVHLAFPSVPEQHHWIEEGLATYVEPIARAQLGQISVERVWREMLRGLPQGLPQEGDRGLDLTPTWGRTYWGGALFALLAEVEIRQRTDNRFGLQHALRAILQKTGGIEYQSDLRAVLRIGDAAVGTSALTDLYDRMRSAPYPVDLEVLWSRLGVRLQGRDVVFDDAAPLAAIRRAITEPLR